MNCSVNILLLILAVAKVLWHLRSLIIHNTGTHTLVVLSAAQISFCMVIGETWHHAQAQITFRELVRRACSLATYRTNGFAVCWILPASSGYGGSPISTFARAALVLPTKVGIRRP